MVFAGQRSIVPAAAAVLAAAIPLGLIATDARAGVEACHVATVVFRLGSLPEGLLWTLEFDVDPAPAGGSFLESDGALDCEFVLDGCSGCPGGSATLDQGSGVATFTVDGGLQGVAGGDPLFVCHVATGGALPAAPSFDIDVVSATASLPPDPPAPVVVGVEVDSVSCGAGCPEWPRAGCLEAGSSSLLIEPFRSARLLWKWKKGPAVGIGDLSDPTTTGHYTACLYSFDTTGMTGAYPQFTLEQRLPVVSGWSRLGSRGYRYRDDLQAMGPVRRLMLKAGAQGRTKATLRIDGPDERFVPATGVTVQLVDALGDLCWESRYSGYEPDEERFEGRTGD